MEELATVVIPTGPGSVVQRETVIAEFTSSVGWNSPNELGEPRKVLRIVPSLWEMVIAMTPLAGSQGVAERRALGALRAAKLGLLGVNPRDILWALVRRLTGAGPLELRRLVRGVRTVPNGLKDRARLVVVVGEGVADTAKAVSATARTRVKIILHVLKKSMGRGKGEFEGRVETVREVTTVGDVRRTRRNNEAG